MTAPAPTPAETLAAKIARLDALREKNEADWRPSFRELLRTAEIRLMQSEECRIGYIADSFKQDAADLLRRAGLADLADRIEDDPWSADVGAVLAEVTCIRGVT